MSTGELQGKALEHPGPVTSLAESRDGSFLLTGCAGGTSRIWEAKTDKLQGSAFKHPKTRDYGSAILAVALSPDCKVVLTGSEDTTVRVWDRETGRQNGKPLQLAGVVHGVSFSPDGVTFLTSSGAETVQLWDTATRSSLATILRPSNVDDAPSPPVEGFVYPWSNVAIAFTPNGQQVFYSSNERLLRHELLPPVAREPERLRLSIELRSLMTETEFGQLRLLTESEFIDKHKQLQVLGGDRAVREWSDLSQEELDAVAGRK